MIQRAFTIRVAEYDHPEELQPEQEALVRRAMEAAGNAYAPYSSYRVGAALLLENGEVVTGNNQENAAYPSGLCAERVAVFYAGAQYPGVPVRKLAIAAMQNNRFQEQPAAPCGGCRQVLYEKEMQGGKPMEVILYGSLKIRVLRQAADLLPLPFEYTRPG
jgi:cytidine deaminase